MRASVLYDELEEIEELLGEYTRARGLDEGNRQEVIWVKLLESAKKSNLIEEEPAADHDRLIERLHQKLNLFRETQFRYGLHTLGQAPDEDRMAHMLVSIIRF